MNGQASQRQDLSELVNHPPENAESYWFASGGIEPSIGALAVRVWKDDARMYVQRLHRVESTIGILPTYDEPSKIDRQIHISPHESIEVNLVDYNSSFVYAGHEEVLQTLSKGAARAISMQAYSRMGALNQSRDLGLYLLPLVPSMVMRGLRRHGETVGFEEQSIDYLLDMLGEFNSGRYAQAGSKFAEFKRHAWENCHQPGSINFATSALMEVGAYFADFDEINGQGGINGRLSAQRRGDVSSVANDLSEAALRVSRELLAGDMMGSNINNQVSSQLQRRQYDVEFLDLYRRAKLGLIEPDEALEEFALYQRGYIKKLEQWMDRAPDEEGVTFEWIKTLILRHHRFRRGAIDSGHEHYAAHRQDFPEDNLPGNTTGNNQAIDVVRKEGNTRQLVQCKLKATGCYARPITVVEARPLTSMQDANHKKNHPDKIPSSMTPYFRATVAEIKAAYEASDAPESARYLELEDLLLGKIAV